jgi:PRTRC genetic system ThiF family protein
MSDLDLSFLRAQPVFSLQSQRMLLALVGTGGTGSFLARHVARLAWILQTQHEKDVTVAFIDHDIVERANVLRQDFCEAEIGLHKAQTLALRYSAAFGIQIRAITNPFHPDMIKNLRSYWNSLAIVVGAVDNAAARQQLSLVLQDNTQEVPSTWWVDCGNGLDYGQVLIGTHNNGESLADAFKVPGFCRKLPSPALQHPELLVPLPEELSDHQLSCEQLLAANVQSAMINQQVAAYAAEVLYELLIVQKLRRFATYFHQPSGSANSRYITPEAVADVIGTEPTFFTEQRQKLAEDEEDEEDEDDEIDLA